MWFLDVVLGMISKVVLSIYSYVGGRRMVEVEVEVEVNLRLLN